MKIRIWVLVTDIPPTSRSCKRRLDHAYCTVRIEYMKMYLTSRLIGFLRQVEMISDGHITILARYVCKYVVGVSLSKFLRSATELSATGRPRSVYVTYLVCKYIADISCHRTPSTSRNCQRQIDHDCCTLRINYEDPCLMSRRVDSSYKLEL